MAQAIPVCFHHSELQAPVAANNLQSKKQDADSQPRLSGDFVVGSQESKLITGMFNTRTARGIHNMSGWNPNQFAESAGKGVPAFQDFFKKPVIS